MEPISAPSLWSILVFVAWAWPASLVLAVLATYFMCRKSSGQATFDKALDNDERVIGALLEINEDRKKGYDQLVSEWKTLARTAGHKAPSPPSTTTKPSSPAAPSNGKSAMPELVLTPDRIANGGHR